MPIAQSASHHFLRFSSVHSKISIDHKSLAKKKIGANWDSKQNESIELMMMKKHTLP